MVEITALLLIIQQELKFLEIHQNSSSPQNGVTRSSSEKEAEKESYEAISCMANVAKMCILHDVCLTVY